MSQNDNCSREERCQDRNETIDKSNDRATKFLLRKS